LSGVSYLSDANKQRAAQQAALDKNRVAAMHYANVGDYYKDMKPTKEERTYTLAQKETQSARDDYDRFERTLGARFKDQYPMASMNLEDPKNKKIYDNFMAQYEPILNNLRIAAKYPNFSLAKGSGSPIQTQADAIINPKQK